MRLEGIHHELMEIAEDDAHECIPRICRDWCLKRPGKQLNADIQRRWGMAEAQEILDEEGEEDRDEDNIIYDGEMDDLDSRWRLSHVKLGDGKSGNRKSVYYGAEIREGPWYEIVFCTILSVELEDGDLSKPKPFVLPQPRTKFNMKEYKERIIRTEEGRRLFKMKEEPTHIMLDWLDLAC